MSNVSIEALDPSQELSWAEAGLYLDTIGLDSNEASDC